MSDRIDPDGLEPDDEFDLARLAGTESDPGLDAVSALVDGTASPEQTALVASDAELRALADELLGLRDTMLDIDAVALADEPRSNAISAALAVFDELQAASGVDASSGHGGSDGERSMSAAPVIDIATRRRAKWLMNAAAAVVAVVAVGGLTVGLLGGNDADESVADPAVASDQRTAESFGAPAAEAAPKEDDVPVGGATAATAVGDVAAEDALTMGAAPDATMAAAAEINDAAVVALPELASVDALRSWAVSANEIIPLPGQFLPCVPEGGTSLGDVVFQGIEAIVVRDASGALQVVTREGCEVLASAG
jgi:hypothetical protein